LSGYTVDEIVDRYNSFSDEDFDLAQFIKFTNGMLKLPDSIQNGVNDRIENEE